MIEIYNKNNINFEQNGDITLDPFSCVYKSELNAIKEVTLDHDIDDLGRWKYIKEDNILAISSNEKKAFYRIYNINKTLDTIKAYARPVFYDLIDNILFDVRPTDKTGQQAIDIILNNTPFKGYSDIKTTNTSYYVRKNIVESLLSNDENSFLNRWGGELYLDNWNVHLNNKIGHDNGVRIKFKYNLTSVEQDINLDSVVTRIIPVGYDALMLDGATPFVDSELINKYSNIKTRVINFDDVKVKSDNSEDGFNTIDEARQELIRRCKELFKDGIDKPLINYKIAMEDLSTTTEYKEYKLLQTVGEGDIVTCKIEHLDIDVSTRCISIERNELTNEIISLELGNFKENFFQNQIDLNNKLENILNSNGSVNSQKLQGIIDGVNTKFKVQRDIAQKQEVRAMLFEDKIKGSATYGALCLGTMGFQISNRRTPDDKDWIWDTAATGSGIIADWLVGNLCTVLITNVDGSIQLDLSSSDGLQFKQNGHKSMELSGNNLYFYDWQGSTRENPIGTLFSGRRIDDETGVNKDKPGLFLAHHEKAYLALGFYDKSLGNYVSYIDFDHDKILGRRNFTQEELEEREYLIKNSSSPILIRDFVDFLYRPNIKYGMHIGKNNEHLVYSSNSENLCFDVLNRVGFYESTTDKSIFTTMPGSFRFGHGPDCYFYKNPGDRTIYIDGDLQISGEVKGVIKNMQGDIIYPPPEPPQDESGNAIINSARKLIGKPYVWGGNYPPLGSNNGTDCSGLCQWAFNDNGMRITRTTYTQINEGIEVYENDLKAGDLVFSNFSSGNRPEHVFLYVGKVNGSHMCVEAPSTGKLIRERSFVWGNGYRARRLLLTKKDTEALLNNKIKFLEDKVDRLEALIMNL